MDNSFSYEEEPVVAADTSTDMASDDDKSAEDLFIEGFEDSENFEECAECRGAAREPVVCEIKDEILKFCSKECAQDYEDSVL